MSFVPPDGQITSLQVLPNTLTGSEVQEIVSPGNANEGNSYQVTTGTLGQFYANFVGLNRTVITAGATIGIPYPVAPTDTQIFFDKTISSPSFALCPLATMMFSGDVLFKDYKGDAGSGNPITIDFTGGQLCDGKTQIVIDNAYGWVHLSPGPTVLGGSGWCVVG